MRFIPMVASLVFLVGPLHGQSANPLSLVVGDQISLREPQAGGVRLRGTVLQIDDDAITYVVPGNHRQYFRPYAGIDTIDVKRRIPRASALSGAAWGAFLGASAGIIAGPFYAMSGSLDTGPAMAALGAGGGIGGAFIGAAARTVLFPGLWFRHVLP